MKLKLIASGIIGLLSFPLFAADCPMFNPNTQYVNGDQIQVSGSFYQAQNNPHKGAEVTSSWYWENIPECTKGLTTLRHEHPQRFLEGVKTPEVIAGDGITTYTQLTQNSLNVVVQLEGGKFKTHVKPANVVLTEQLSMSHSKAQVRADKIELVQEMPTKTDVTKVEAKGVVTPLVEAEKMLITPMAIVGGRNVMAYIASLEARIAELEAKLP
ncbi:hypothetical protein MHO82_13380 [Vibrio sp. Of7-15]|uniref:hypothetical protein n=1 Tax=Vibrio sp. Of7-15 TaxID=2724879 RepID=UPI001EF37BDF|nr:hypothetical protein [Vibrio sp. Of7-15]MCG7497856.1 hypothetical protein [Vibrio sp. Of7-15]